MENDWCRQSTQLNEFCPRSRCWGIVTVISQLWRRELWTSALFDLAPNLWTRPLSALLQNRDSWQAHQFSSSLLQKTWEFLWPFSRPAVSGSSYFSHLHGGAWCPRPYHPWTSQRNDSQWFRRGFSRQNLHLSDYSEFQLLHSEKWRLRWYSSNARHRQKLRYVHSVSLHLRNCSAIDWRIGKRSPRFHRGGAHQGNLIISRHNRVKPLCRPSSHSQALKTPSSQAARFKPCFDIAPFAYSKNLTRAGCSSFLFQSFARRFESRRFRLDLWCSGWISFLSHIHAFTRGQGIEEWTGRSMRSHIQDTRWLHSRACVSYQTESTKRH